MGAMRPLLPFTAPQSEAPYNKAAFEFEITFPAKYPFQPPKVL